jgi:hypothetical protein
LVSGGTQSAGTGRFAMPCGIRHFAVPVELAKNQTLEFWRKPGAAAVGCAQAAGFSRHARSPGDNRPARAEGSQESLASVNARWRARVRPDALGLPIAASP